MGSKLAAGGGTDAGRGAGTTRSTPSVGSGTARRDERRFCEEGGPDAGEAPAGRGVLAGTERSTCSPPLASICGGPDAEARGGADAGSV